MSSPQSVSLNLSHCKHLSHIEGGRRWKIIVTVTYRLLRRHDVGMIPLPLYDSWSRDSLIQPAAQVILAHQFPEIL